MKFVVRGGCRGSPGNSSRHPRAPCITFCEPQTSITPGSRITEKAVFRLLKNSRVLWNLTFRYFLDKIPPPVHIPSLMNSVHSHSVSLKFIFRLYSHLHLGHQTSLFLSVFLTEILSAFFLLCVQYFPPPRGPSSLL
jgi:hypothetical protein